MFQPVIIAIAITVFILNSDNKIVENQVTPQILTQNGSPMLGNPSSPITILEWGDYQCTFCYKFHISTRSIIMDEYVNVGKVNFVFKDFPLNGPDSILAAEASYCADDQGKYWEYHDQLYNNWAGERTGWITRESLDVFAQRIDIDTTGFNKCLDEQKYRDKVLENERFGIEIGIKATPSFLIFDNEQIIKIEGNQPLQVFTEVLDGM